MKFENTSVYNVYNAILGARNPMNSWNKSDSVFNGYDGKIENTHIGKNDLELAQRLIKAGSEHRKFLRQIMVSVDITAPLYWWKEFDTYKVGTVANSTSTMHKLATTSITLDCFEMDDYETELQKVNIPLMWEHIIFQLETLRNLYGKTKDKRYWKELIRLLPESWLQTRTVTMSYENILNMYHHRKNHKLNEWSGKDDSTKPNFCTWVLGLPYAKQFFIEPFEGGRNGSEKRINARNVIGKELLEKSPLGYIYVHSTKQTTWKNR